jgi:Xaa-Pro aminopeptidase
MDPILLHPQDLAGLSCREKIEMVRAQLRKTGATHYVVNTLDEIAWATNTRGSDIPFNPVYHAFMVIGPEQTDLFTYTQKLTAPTKEYFSAQGIEVHPYDNIYFFLTGLNSHDIVFLDPERTNFALTSALSRKVKIKEGAGIITLLKGVKNEVEIRHIRETMRLDGIAMVRFLKWLEESVPEGNVTELSATVRLKEFRAESDRFIGESFNTISGYGAHGAIVHYSVTPQSDSPLRSEGIYLLDSGGQYVTGTTDLTRTIALGPVPEQAKTDFTLVLKGHIALARVTFPKGTRGVHLDILARQFLWEHQLNYGHGTGHGVGYFLNVHEGPQSIRPQDNGVEIEPGMITSNEPGLYRRGQYGIRTENLVVTKEVSENEFGTFLAFETLTLCPIDRSLIKVELLSPSEKEWINQYHQKVYSQLKTALGNEEAEWLKAKTAAI